MSRNNVLMTVIGKQRIGKTTETRKEMIRAYLRGSKVLILDPNDEIKMKYYSSREILQGLAEFQKKGWKTRLSKADISRYKKSPSKEWLIKALPYNYAEEDADIRAKYIAQYGRNRGYGMARLSLLTNSKEVDSGATSKRELMTYPQQRQLLKDLLKYFNPSEAGLRNGFVFIDDIQKIIEDLHNDKEVTGALVNINHRGTDLIAHYHDPMLVPPRLYRLGEWVRLHATVQKIRNDRKYQDFYEIMKIAETIISEEEKNKGNERRFVYFNVALGKIYGVSKADYENAVRKFLRRNLNVLKGYSGIDDWMKENNYLSK